MMRRKAFRARTGRKTGSRARNFYGSAAPTCGFATGSRWEAGSIRPLALFFLVAAAITLAAATLLYAQSERGDYTQRNLGSLAQPALPSHTDDAKYSVGSYPLYWSELEPGEGKDVVTGYCNACHSPRYIPMQPPLTHDQWAAEVTKMVKTFGIDIPEPDQAIITKYLTDHYSPETRKK